MPTLKLKTEITNHMAKMSINNERSSPSELKCKHVINDNDIIQKTDEHSIISSSKENDKNMIHKNRDNNKMRRKCNICEEFGHISLDCKSQIKTTCFNCGSINHRSRNCPYINDPNLKQVCRKFIQNGTCLYGRSCKFSHNRLKINDMVSIDIRDKGSLLKTLVHKTMKNGETYKNTLRFSGNKQKNISLVNDDRLNFYKNNYKHNPNFDNFHSENKEKYEIDNLEKEIEMLKLKLGKEKFEGMQVSMKDNERGVEQCNDLLNDPNMISKIDDNLTYKEYQIDYNKRNDKIERDNCRKDDDY